MPRLKSARTAPLRSFQTRVPSRHSPNNRAASVSKHHKGRVIRGGDEIPPFWKFFFNFTRFIFKKRSRRRRHVRLRHERKKYIWSSKFLLVGGPRIVFTRIFLPACVCRTYLSRACMVRSRNAHAGKEFGR